MVLINFLEKHVDQLNEDEYSSSSSLLLFSNFEHKVFEFDHSYETYKSIILPKIVDYRKNRGLRPYYILKLSDHLNDAFL